MRKPLVAGNWKMNLDLPRARGLVAEIRSAAPPPAKVELALCPPYPYLFPMAKAVANSGIALGSQDLSIEREGAFTGEVSAEMVRETGATYAIIGHSERRHSIGHLEDDRMINLKLRAAHRAGLTPILCVGETLAERKAGQTLDVLTFQIAAGLVSADLPSGDRLVVAYEPVWAIGTGLNATPEQAQEAHAHLRACLRRLVGGIADGVRILYGGSLKPDNADSIFRQPDVDGGLVGGASLKADSFLGIARAALATVA
jgi:triosephosphate isomerase